MSIIFRIIVHLQRLYENQQHTLSTFLYIDSVASLSLRVDAWIRQGGRAAALRQAAAR
jgi:hypothetical protein